MRSRRLHQPRLIMAPSTVSSQLRRLLEGFLPPSACSGLWPDLEALERKVEKVDELVKAVNTLAKAVSELKGQLTSSRAKVQELQGQLTTSNLQIQHLQAKFEALEQAAVDKGSKSAQQRAIAAKMQQVLQQRQQPQQPQKVVAKEEEAMAQGAPVTRVMTTTTLEEASHDYEGLGDYVL